MSYTIDDLNRVVAKAYNKDYDPEEYFGDGDSREWDNLEDALSVARRDGEAIELGVGAVRLLSTFGGEGEGSDYHLVVSVTDSEGGVRYFKRHGWYASFDGGYYEGPTAEVEPKQKTITVYEPIK